MNYPKLTLLQNFTRDSNGQLLNRFNSIFLWNNGQKIFVGTWSGIISIYESNSDRNTWTKFSNVASINYPISSIFVNKAGTTMYATIDNLVTSDKVVSFTWNGSLWSKSYPINLVNKAGVL